MGEAKQVVTAAEAASVASAQSPAGTVTVVAAGPVQGASPLHATTVAAPVVPAATDTPQVAPAATDTPQVAPAAFRFAKLFGPTDIVVFDDGTHFKFPLIRENTKNGGFSSVTEVDTTDPVLAAKLRKATKIEGLGLVEVKA